MGFQLHCTDEEISVSNHSTVEWSLWVKPTSLRHALSDFELLRVSSKSLLWLLWLAVQQLPRIHLSPLTIYLCPVESYRCIDPSKHTKTNLMLPNQTVKNSTAYTKNPCSRDLHKTILWIARLIKTIEYWKLTVKVVPCDNPWEAPWSVTEISY